VIGDSGARSTWAARRRDRTLEWRHDATADGSPETRGALVEMVSTRLAAGEALTVIDGVVQATGRSNRVSYADLIGGRLFDNKGSGTAGYSKRPAGPMSRRRSEAHRCTVIGQVACRGTRAVIARQGVGRIEMVNDCAARPNAARAHDARPIAGAVPVPGRKRVDQDTSRAQGGVPSRICSPVAPEKEWNVVKARRARSR